MHGRIDADVGFQPDMVWFKDIFASSPKGSFSSGARALRYSPRGPLAC